MTADPATAPTRPPGFHLGGVIAAVFVPGEPRAQGSKRGRVIAGRAVLVESNPKGLVAWRAAITYAAASLETSGGKYTPLFVADQAVGLHLTFVLPRPKSAPKSGDLVELANKKPDIDKLARAVLDALTGVWMRDDSQVVCLLASKRVARPGERPGVLVELLDGPRL